MKKAIILPDKEEILRRLLKTDSSPRLREEFYPLLVKHASEEKSAEEIFQIILEAVRDYTENTRSVMQMMMHLMSEDFIDALINNRKVAEQAKLLCKEFDRGSD